MPSTFSNLGLELQATGENANTWGDKTNVGLQRVDNAIAGYTTVQANSTTITLAFSTNSGSTTFTDENGRNKILKFTSGTAGAAITVTVPDIEKEYLVRNETGQNITFSAGGGTTVTLATGKNAHIYIDGASAVYNGLADIVTTSLDTGAITTTGITTTGDINFGDNDKAVFGAGSDLQIYHDGSNSYIRDNGTGGLNIQGSTSVVIEDTDGNNMIACNDGGAVNLYHGAGSNKLQTTSTGVNVTGTVTADGLSLGDNENLSIGASGDLKMFHDGVGGNSYIQDAGTGDLYLDFSDDFIIRKFASAEVVAQFNSDGAVELYYDNSKKLETTSSGIDVTGQVLADKAYIAEATLTDGATINWDMADESVAKVTLGGNRTLAAPTNGSTGQFASLLVIQDGTGTRTLTFNAVYEFKDDTAPTLTSTGGKGDLFVFRYNGSKWLEVGRNLNLTLS